MAQEMNTFVPMTLAHAKAWADIVCRWRDASRIVISLMLGGQPRAGIVREWLRAQLN